MRTDALLNLSMVAAHAGHIVLIILKGAQNEERNARKKIQMPVWRNGHKRIYDELPLLRMHPQNK